MDGIRFLSRLPDDTDELLLQLPDEILDLLYFIFLLFAVLHGLQTSAHAADHNDRDNDDQDHSDGDRQHHIPQDQIAHHGLVLGHAQCPAGRLDLCRGEELVLAVIIPDLRRIGEIHAQRFRQYRIALFLRQEILIFMGDYIAVRIEEECLYGVLAAHLADDLCQGIDRKIREKYRLLALDRHRFCDRDDHLSAGEILVGCGIDQSVLSDRHFPPVTGPAWSDPPGTRHRHRQSTHSTSARPHLPPD